MKRAVLALGLALAALDAAAWGSDGHSIVGEIAQRRLGPGARAQVEALLGAGHSLASEGNWADDVRPARPETFNWHFVDIPIADATYDAAKQCAATPQGDCIVAELERLQRSRLNCIAHLLSQIPYQEVPHEPVYLPERVRNPNYLRGPIPPAMF